MRSSIIFNGKSSEDFGLVVEYVPASIHASRRGELITIPGRNGVIVQEDGSYETYTQTYRVWFNSRVTNSNDTFRAAREVASWLLKPSGFCRLEDTYEPDHFRFARYSGPLDVETVLRQFGRATLEFVVQPQRYLKSGEMQVKFNKVTYESAPLINRAYIYSIPDYVERIKIVSTSKSTVLEIGNRKAYAGLTEAVEGNYVFGLDLQEGDANAKVSSGAIRTLPYIGDDQIGEVRLFLVDSNGREEKVLEYNTTEFALSNPTNNVAKPLLMVEQKQEPEEGEDNTEAVATINGTTVTVDFTNGSVVYLDCDLHDAYYPDGSSANSAVSFTSEVDAYPTFPTFFEGEQHIIVAESMYYSVKISPRWWAL